MDRNKLIRFLATTLFITSSAYAYSINQQLLMGITPGTTNQLVAGSSGIVTFCTTDPEIGIANNGGVGMPLNLSISSGSVPGLTFANSGNCLKSSGTPSTAGTYSVTVTSVYAWVASSGILGPANYLVGNIIIDPSNHVQQVTTAGTSKTGSAPSWNDTGGTTADNTVVWQDQGVLVGSVPTQTFTVPVLVSTPSPSFGSYQSGAGAGVVMVQGIATATPYTATGSSATYTAALASGALPTGIVIVNKTVSETPSISFFLTGTPTTSGVYVSQITITGNLGDATTEYVTITVAPVPVTNSLLVGGGTSSFNWYLPLSVIGQSYSTGLTQNMPALAAMNHLKTGPFTFTKNGTWPSWLGLVSNGTLSGSPTVIDIDPLGVTMLDHLGSNLGANTISIVTLAAPLIGSMPCRLSTGPLSSGVTCLP